MSELRSTFGAEQNPSEGEDSKTSELKAIAEQNRLKGSLLGSAEQSEALASTRIMMFGKSEEVEYYPAPTDPEKIVVEFTRQDGSKGKTNFTRLEFESRREQAK